MSMRLQCACGKIITVKEGNAGKRFACPDCGRALVVPKRRLQEQAIPQIIISEASPRPKRRVDWKAIFKGIGYFLIAIGGLLGFFCWIVLILLAGYLLASKIVSVTELSLLVIAGLLMFIVFGLNQLNSIVTKLLRQQELNRKNDDL